MDQFCLSPGRSWRLVGVFLPYCMTLCQEQGFWQKDSWISLLDSWVWFHVFPVCKSLSINFWISHKRNLSVNYCWIVVFIEGRWVLGFLLYYLADVPELIFSDRGVNSTFFNHRVIASQHFSCHPLQPQILGFQYQFRNSLELPTLCKNGRTRIRQVHGQDKG